MVMLGPVSVSMPSFISKEQLTGAFGCAGGLIFSDYIAASLVSRLGWTGATALAASAGAKIGVGALLWYGATKAGGALAKPLLGLAAVGCFASIIIDGVRYVYPLIGGSSARLSAAMRGSRPAVAVGAVTLRAVAAPQIQPRAETPSAYALGGF